MIFIFFLSIQFSHSNGIGFCFAFPCYFLTPFFTLISYGFPFVTILFTFNLLPIYFFILFLTKSLTFSACLTARLPCYYDTTITMEIRKRKENLYYFLMDSFVLFCSLFSYVYINRMIQSQSRQNDVFRGIYMFNACHRHTYSYR